MKCELFSSNEPGKENVFGILLSMKLQKYYSENAVSTEVTDIKQISVRQHQNSTCHEQPFVEFFVPFFGLFFFRRKPNVCKVRLVAMVITIRICISDIFSDIIMCNLLIMLSLYWTHSMISDQ